MQHPLSDSLEGKFYLSDLSEKDKPWDEHRRTAETVEGMYRDIGYERYAERMAQCSTKLEFIVKRDIEGKNHLKLHAARFCRVRFCPICQWRKELMWRARLFKHVPKIINDYPTHRYVFGTFTVKNCDVEDLRSTIKLMNEGWNRMTKRKGFPAQGFVRCLEVTRGVDSTAHPHFHVLMIVKPSFFTHGYVKQSEWTELWKESMRLDYTPIVDIRAVKNLKPKKNSQVPKGMESGICEVMKYSVKESDLISDPYWLSQLTTQMHKVRTVSLGGIFKKYLSEDDPEDLIHGDIQDDSEVEFTDESFILFTEWNNWSQRYQVKSCRDMPKEPVLETCNK